MKKTLLLMAAWAMASGAAADATISGDNPDLDGWAVENHEISHIGHSAYEGDKLRPGDIAFGNPDLDGWVVNDRGLLGGPMRKHTVDPSKIGVGDSYGSVLHEVGFNW